MSERNEFDIYFNFNDEDHYLTESLSQYMRDKGLRTFDRSVDQLPDQPEFAISEADALARSKMMIAVLTENSCDDASFRDMTSRARALDKPVTVLRFDDSLVPSYLTGYTIIETSRKSFADALNRISGTIL